MPLFSVVIPCWNTERTLAETLRSVAAQTFADWEAVVVDDGSDDATGDIARGFATRDARFRLVRLENGGPARARNIGALAHARGHAIAFLDADDLWSPSKLARMAERLAVPGAPEALYGRVAFFRTEPRAARTFSTVPPRPLTPGDLLRENAVCSMSNLVVRADVFRASGGFDESMVHGEDVEWLVRITAAGARVVGIDETLVHYRATDGSLSVDLAAMHAGWRRSVATARRLGIRLSREDLAAAEAVHLRYLARRALRIRVPRATAFRFAWYGARLAPRAFFGSPWRGGMTFAAACAEPLMPDALRRLAFSF